MEVDVGSTLEVDVGSTWLICYYSIIQTKDSKQGQGRGRRGHDAEVEHEEDDATTSEQQRIEKQSEECSGEWETHVQEQPIVSKSNTFLVLYFVLHG